MSRSYAVVCVLLEHGVNTCVEDGEILHARRGCRRSATSAQGALGLDWVMLSVLSILSLSYIMRWS
jgi:hypothetical protein